MKIKIKSEHTFSLPVGRPMQNMAQAVLEDAKAEIIAHSENGITLAGVEIILDRLIEEYGR